MKIDRDRVYSVFFFSLKLFSKVAVSFGPFRSQLTDVKPFFESWSVMKVPF